MIAVTGVIVIVIIVVMFILSKTTGARSISVAEAASGQFAGQRVQVTGLVADNSYTLDAGNLDFTIYDSEDPTTTLQVSYRGAMSATFGNQVTAICTGTITAEGVLQCTELVTKCPSKYEDSGEALSVSQLFEYGDSIVDVSVKVTGIVKANSTSSSADSTSLILLDPITSTELPVVFFGEPPGVAIDGAQLTITGSFNADGTFHATDIVIGN